MQEIAWGRLVPGAVIERADGRRFRVLAVDPEIPGRVLLANPGDTEDDASTFEVTRDPRSPVKAGLPIDVVAVEYAARRLPATVIVPPVPNARLAQHLYRMHNCYIEPSQYKKYDALRKLHDQKHEERDFWLPHEHRQKGAS